ncbi:hypothetical protein HBI56_209150 [Parastagonospora nodorum]|uniref:Uncharacterized protein n=1 Tax=Phaeosphaeria nodorum (strain SN15 / ATCC MYA-4574 / FGSC 10173) TaxID=321614 RepID=A0A7U2I4A3_PHANO|nr:hypothetical protein HBH56_219650 [Parastagonospora nodorum]QRD01204.1 hypothetical protein JI435_416300 [Parastagonospora nodorum SN15]KAH3922024.1 hypothetical protein HBH54_229780 [Parastagonospora nodorum]KAH3991610.1 hypothetical protein HBI10_229920 [Parastagonospora nodorum]KAH4009487.1 hypothetical protein HBI13_219100 [Parastagonospora nodorum]
MSISTPSRLVFKPLWKSGQLGSVQGSASRRVDPQLEDHFGGTLSDVHFNVRSALNYR